MLPDRFTFAHRRLLACGLLAVCCFQGGVIHAQYGASPSQTGMFFNDLRNRVYQKDQQSGVRGGEAVYDYSRGVYVGAADERAMGQAAEVSASESMRQMGEPAVRSGYAGYSARAAGDYGRYSGPYPSESTFFAPTYVSDPFLGGRRNLKIGPVNVGFGLTSSVEYNDNITRSSTDPIDDVISTTLLSITANYQITRNNALTLNTTLGFDHYFNHPEVAPYGGDFVLNVLPGSSIAFDMKVGPVDFVIYDRMSVRPATQNDFALDPTEVFGVFQNDAGIAAQWAVNSDINLSLNFMRSDAISMEDEANIFDRQTNSIHGSLAWSPHQTWTLGVEGGASWVSYPEGFNNDGVLTNAGVFYSMPISRSTFVRVSAGVQSFDFDAPDQEDVAAGVSNGDGSNLSDYYYNVSLTNQFNARISQTLSFGHESALNTTSNYVTADFVSYGVGIIAWRGSRLSLSGYYEDSEESGGSSVEDLQQYGFDAYLSHQLNSRARLGFGYHYGDTSSSIIGRDYVQHAFNIDFTYALSRKLSMSLGYRFWTTDADDEGSEFDQSRAIMSMSYNFGP